METKRKLIHISHKIRALTKFSPRIHHLIFLLRKEKENESFSKPFKPFGNYIFLSVFSILKFKQFLKKQCGESEKSPCRAKLCRLESKAGFSQSFELAHYSAVESNFLKSFFSQHHLPFLQSLTFFLHSLFAFCLEELMMINFLLFSSLM